MTTLYILNSKCPDPNIYIFSALVRALRLEVSMGRGGAISSVCELGLDTLMAEPRTPSPAALLVYGGEELNTSLKSEQLRERFAFTAIWFTEDPYERNLNKVAAKDFDLVYTNDTGSCQFYLDMQGINRSGRPAVHLPLAADPAFLPFSQLPNPDRLCFFSGTGWPNRKQMLGKVASLLGPTASLDFHLVANAFVEAAEIGSQRLPSGLAFSNPISISEFCMRASRSLCTIVMGRSFSGSGYSLFARSPGPRLFEAGITGTCQLVHGKEIPDIPEGIEIGTHVLHFSNEEELLSLLRQAELQPAPFRKIGLAMREEVLKSHTYVARASQLLKDISKELQSRKLQPVALRSAKRKRYLFLTHELTGPDSHHGGAGICLERILKAVAPAADVQVLSPVGDNRQYILTDAKGMMIKRFRLTQTVDHDTLRHQELEELLVKLFQDFRPHLVHVNHLLGFSPSLVPLIRKCGAIAVATLHDYYTICDSWNLLDAKHEFCGINSFHYQACTACTKNRWPQAPNPDQLRRRVAFAEAIHNCNHLIAPSFTATRRLQAVFGRIQSLHVIEPVSTGIVRRDIHDGKESRVLTVLFTGNLAINKGYDDLKKLVDQVESLGLPIKFRILGRADRWITNILSTATSVELHGRYRQEELHSLALGADLALFLSPWPETYCMTFDEIAALGLPIFFYEMGAMAEPHRRESLHPMSKSFAPRDVGSVLACLIEHLTPAKLAQLRQTFSTRKTTQSPPIQFGERHRQLFEEWCREASSALDAPSLNILGSRVISQPILQPHWLIDREAGAAMGLPKSWKRRLWNRSRDLLYSSRIGTRIVHWSRRWR